MPQNLIVVVDDDPTLQKLLDRILRLEGYQTRVWSRSTGAYELVRDTQPSLVLLDMNLEQPRAGLGVLELLRADDATANVPVLVCCGDRGLVEAEWEHLQRLRCEVVLKPVSPEMLVKKIAAMLG